MAYSRKKRYSRYRYAIKQLGATQADTNKPLGKFLAYERGEIQITRTGVATGQKEPREILAFGVAASSPKFLILTAGRPLTTGLEQAGLAETDLAITTPGASSTAVENNGFYAAKAIVFVGTGTAVPHTSHVTNKTYKRVGGHSFTFPFGQSTGPRANFFGACEYIKNKIEAGNTNRGVTFQPERLFY